MNLADEIEKLAKLEWLPPWEPLNPTKIEPINWMDKIFGLDRELSREVGRSHPLYRHRKKAILVGARIDCDDRLYLLPNFDQPFAVVHLTWSGKTERNGFPATRLFSSLEEWIGQCLIIDHKNYQDR